MIYKQLPIRIILFLFVIIGFNSCKKEVEVIDENEYGVLSDKYYENQRDSSRAVVYAKRYLLKAKEDSDTLKIANGYYFLSKISRNAVSLSYSDSIIAITKNHNNRYYPTYAYRNKAVVYFEEGNFQKAFSYFIDLNGEARKYNVEHLIYDSHRAIGIVTSHLGEHKTALKIFRQCHAHFSKSKEKAPYDYLSTLFALSDSYTRNRKLDSATYINNKGYKESILLGDEDFKYFFTLNEGVNQYHKGNYEATTDSINKAIPTLKKYENTPNIGMAYYYLGKALLHQGKTKEALIKHEKADQIFQKTNSIIVESKENSKTLIDHYKKEKNPVKQLEYHERLRKLDSILDDDYRFLFRNLMQKYITPQLLSEKEEIINSLEQDKKSLNWKIGLLAALALISIVFLIYNYVKRKTYKRRFDELYAKSETNIKQKPIKQNEIDSIGVSEDIIKDILNKLSEFEKNLDFLQSDITTNSLSKRFNTNSKYLSKVINTYKNKSFSTYINELRIDYSISKLKTDRKFKNYTMKAIAKEIGFNTPQAFSKSFYKKNGIHPSYFIKQLEKQQN